MKAKQNFVLYLDSNRNPVSYYSGESMDGKIVVKLQKGDEIPDDLVSTLLKRLPDYVDVEYKAGQFVLTDEEKKRFGMASGKIEVTPIVTPRKYSQNSLTVIYNKEGVKELKRIAEEEFNMKDVKASKSLITAILLKQEESRR